MKYVKFPLLVLGLCIMVSQANTQYADAFGSLIYDDYREHTAIYFEGKPLLLHSEGPIYLSPKAEGKITLGKARQTCGSSKVSTDIGFKVGIKDARTNTLWMFSERTFYELNIEDVMEECNRGDKLVIMTVDRNYRLPRHEIFVSDGC